MEKGNTMGIGKLSCSHRTRASSETVLLLICPSFQHFLSSALGWPQEHMFKRYFKNNTDNQIMMNK